LVDDGVMNFSTRRYNYSYTFNSVGEWFNEFSCQNGPETTIFGREVSIQGVDLQNVSGKVDAVQEDIGDPSATGDTLFSLIKTYISDLIGGWIK